MILIFLKAFSFLKIVKLMSYNFKKSAIKPLNSPFDFFCDISFISDGLFNSIRKSFKFFWHVYHQVMQELIERKDS